MTDFIYFLHASYFRFYRDWLARQSRRPSHSCKSDTSTAYFTHVNFQPNFWSQEGMCILAKVILKKHIVLLPLHL